MSKKFFLFSILALFISCSGSGSGESIDDIDSPENIYPSNLQIEIEIFGSTTQNPNGDGSGQISVTATATNAVKYNFNFGTGDSFDSTTGQINYTFTQTGTNEFTVRVLAYSSTNDFISGEETITISVVSSDDYSCPDESNLVWCDEFNYNGIPDDNKWNIETGTGEWGWGNNELQFYTNRTENLNVSNGTLKIIAKKEQYGGMQYTSGRIMTHNKLDFKYGRLEIRAKLPSVQGSWPALWLLGSSYQTNTWPLCGEIDLMEQFADKSYVQTTLHWQNANGSRAQYGQQKNISDPTSFHIYTLDWQPGIIRSFLDGNQIFVMSTNNSMPFDENFFIILNFALGGNGGAGQVAANFVQDVLEIDYVRLYAN